MTKILSILLLGILSASSALAYKDGTYSCKNGDASLPSDTYKVQSTSPLGAQGPQVAYVEITRYYRSDPGDATSPVTEVHANGFATLFTMKKGSETLQLGNSTLDFEDNKFQNCAQ